MRPIAFPASGTRGAVTSGHYLATEAGLHILRQGGNAVDAAAAVNFCLVLLEPHKCGLGGEGPVLVYKASGRQEGAGPGEARPGRVHAISGQGWAPQSLTIEWFARQGLDIIPGDGYLPATVPAVVGTWVLALSRFGTMRLADVLAPAIELAEGGFPVYPALQEVIAASETRFREVYPSTGEVFLPGGRVPEVGQVLRNPDLGRVFKGLARADRRGAAAAGARGEATGGGGAAANRAEGARLAGLEAARAWFYEDEPARSIAEFIRANPVPDASGRVHPGLLSATDLAEWRASLEEPVSLRFRGLDVHKCPPWSQGPAFLQQLALLDGFDLEGMKVGSADYVHTLVECAKLAFADREAYYGDPRFDQVPLEPLLSPDYAATRRGLVGPEASPAFEAGVPAGVAGHDLLLDDVLADNRRALERIRGGGGWGGGAGRGYDVGPSLPGDTTHLDVIDAEGNMVAATPSGAWIQSSPVIRGLGFPLGTRAQMFYLNPDRPNALAPRKRPRTTLSPTIVTHEGQPYLAFGTPGGDRQDQWTLQFFLGHAVYGLGLQEALDEPHFESAQIPPSFYPRQAEPGVILTDGRLPAEVAAELERRGHRLKANDYPVLKMMAARYDERTGVVSAAVCSDGEVARALAW